MPETVQTLEYPEFIQEGSKRLVGQTQDTFENIREHLRAGARTPNQYVARNANQTLADQIALSASGRALNQNIGGLATGAAQSLASQPALTSTHLLAPQLTPASSSDLTNAINTVAGGYRPDLSENSSAVQGAISAAVNPLQRRLTEQLLPQISSAAVQQGAFGGSRADVLRTQALRDFNQEALDLAGQITMSDLQQRRALGTDIFKQQSGLAAENLSNADKIRLAEQGQIRQLMPQLAALDNARASTIGNLEAQGFQSSLLPAQAVDTVGQAEFDDETRRRTELARQFDEEINLPFFGTDIMLRTLSGTPTGTTTTQSSGGDLFGGPAGGILGGGLLGALAGSSNSPLREFITEIPILGSNPVLGGALGGGLLGGLLSL